MYKLSKDETISYFKRVLMFASKQDLYTPFDSALALQINETEYQQQQTVNIYNEIQENFNDNIKANVERYQVIYPGIEPKWGFNGDFLLILDIMGRTAHIAMLDEESFLILAGLIFNRGI